MTASQAIKINIKQVGGPRRASLELRGTVLVYSQKGWAGSASVFIPIEWVNVSSRSRFNIHYLFASFLSGLLFLSLLSGVMYEAGGNGSPWVALGLAAPASACFSVAAYFLYQYLQRRRTTLLRVDTESSGLRIEFWHVPEDNPEIDRLLERLNSLRARIEEVAPYPIQTSHTWYRLRPLRAVLLKGILYSLILYIPVSLIAGFIQMPGLMLFLALPPVFYAAQYGWGFLRNLGNPKSFRAALKSYNRGEMGRADSLLEDALSAHPDHAGSLMLSVYVNVERQQFDRAFAQCRKLAALDRDHADDLVKEVWAIKRMHDRMELEAQK